MKTKKIISDKYQVEAELLDESMVHKVRFLDGERQIVIGLEISYHGDKLEELAKKSVDSYFEHKSQAEGERSPRLHYWFISRSSLEGEECLVAHGVVTGHAKLQDSLFIHTSEVSDFYLDETAGDMVINTRNTTYRCPMAYCDFRKQEEHKEVFSDYDLLRERYEKDSMMPQIEPGNVLLVLADFCEYYFHSLYYRKAGDSEPQKYSAYPHVGTFQDSFLISTEDYEIDLRYFPHYQNIEFYESDTQGMPLYLENLGGTTLYAETREGVIELKAGERKLVAKENVMPKRPFLSNGDLYPAGFFDGDGNGF